MTTPNLPMTDTELAAQWSIQATREGRYELAEAVLRIAAQSYRADQQRQQQRPDAVQVPFAGTTRIERPRLRVATYGPTGDGDADLQREAANVSSTQVMTSPATLDRRCTFKVLKGNVYSECHGGCFWVPGTVGDAHTPATVARWEHVDDELNDDHIAYVEA